MCGDPEMIDRYIPKLRGYSVVDMRLKNITGDGYKMAMAIGADTTHMHVVTSYPYGVPLKGRYGISFNTNEGIIVNIEGERFIEEIKSAPCKIGEAVLLQKKKCQYTIVDYAMWRKGNYRFWGKRGTGPEVMNSMISSRWDLPIFEGDTIKKLAKEAGINPTALHNTVEKYNRYTDKGLDPEFGRDKEYLIKIQEPPFYAIKQVLISTHGGGGLRTNTNLQILDVNGNIIHGLYGCGEVVGGTTGEIYLTSTHYPVAMTFGYWAGKFAAHEALSVEFEK
jgi:fumarate reductase flavoprotein subunit